MTYRMYGSTVQLLRYKISWETGKEEYCISDEHRDEAIRKLGDTPHTVLNLTHGIITSIPCMQAKC